MDERREGGAILIVEDDEATRLLLTTVLDAARFETIAVASGEAALEAAGRSVLAAAVLDVHLAGLSGYEVCRELRRTRGRALPILFVSGERTESFDRVAGLLLGADDYIFKPFGPEDLVRRLEQAIERSHSANRPRSLTSREHQILVLLAGGLEQAEIAARLAISPKTVSTHIERILAKLGVRSRAQAVAVAFREALVST